MRKDGPVSSIIDDLSWRGLIAQSTDLDALRAAADAGPLTLYCGFDPTAPSLHLGNLVQILTVRRFQQRGHRPLALVGGATGLIGDPRMSSERNLNPREVVEGWVDRIRGQLARFYDFDGPNAAIAVNNLDWTEGMGVLDFMRDVGKHFSVNRMLDREAVKARLAGDGISYTEFSYQLLQSYDFVQLFRRYGCTLQTGGSDQWGNITAGVDLIRRMDGGAAHALTTPLLTKADGGKFGKTESGTVWLDPELTSPYAFFQFLLNTDDRDMAMMLRTFSFRSSEEIDALMAELAERPQMRAAQRALAQELTAARPRGGRARRRRGRRSGPVRAGGPVRPARGHAHGGAARGAARGDPRGRGGRRPAAGVRRPVRPLRPGGQQVRRPADDRRGRRLRQQRPGHRCGRSGRR